MSDEGVWVPAEACREIAKVLLPGMHEKVWRDGWRFSDVAWDAAEAVATVANAQLPPVRNVPGKSPNLRVVGSVAPETVGVVEAAVRLGIGRRACLYRVHRGALPGSFQDERGQWWIPAAALDGAA